MHGSKTRAFLGFWYALIQIITHMNEKADNYLTLIYITCPE